MSRFPFLSTDAGQMLDDYRVPNQTLIMGGDVCLWTEYADDESILPRLWSVHVYGSKVVEHIKTPGLAVYVY